MIESNALELLGGNPIACLVGAVINKVLNSHDRRFEILEAISVIVDADLTIMRPLLRLYLTFQ